MSLHRDDYVAMLQRAFDACAAHPGIFGALAGFVVGFAVGAFVVW